MFLLQTILEFSIAGFIIWGLFNEQKVVKFEDKIIAAIKRKAKQKNKKGNVYHREVHYKSDDRSCA